MFLLFSPIQNVVHQCGLALSEGWFSAIKINVICSIFLYVTVGALNYDTKFLINELNALLLFTVKMPFSGRKHISICII